MNLVNIFENLLFSKATQEIISLRTVENINSPTYCRRIRNLSYLNIINKNKIKRFLLFTLLGHILSITQSKKMLQRMYFNAKK